MSIIADMNPHMHPSMNLRIIENLYCEALVLADEIRTAFDPSGQPSHHAENREDAARIALSCEALRATTRMMHGVAWLLNHRAFFMGELTERQLRHRGRLAPDTPAADPLRLALLPPDLRELIARTEHFHARIVRLDQRAHAPHSPSAVTRAIEHLHGRLMPSAA